MEVSDKGYAFFSRRLHNARFHTCSFLLVTRILAISGSLRAQSTNTTLLLAATRLAPPDVQIDLYKGLGDLPLFNPDLDGKEPDAVREFQAALAAADGILICSPEYAHGVSGAMKNALDWLVSDVALVGKSVALINASPRATYAQEALLETLRTMSWNVVSEASRTVPVPRPGLSVDEILGDDILRAELDRAIRELMAAISQSRRIPGGTRAGFT
jgi:chromate reductase, NAD(P)H dehydrogenase (quinone)